MDRAAFSSQLEEWTREMRHVASQQPRTGACAIGTALELWLWTFAHVQKEEADDPGNRERDLSSLSDALCSLASARSLQILQVAGSAPADGEGPESLFTDLCHAESARAAGEVGRICAEVVFGRLVHPTWDHGCEACIQAEDVDALEGIIPGISYGARLTEDVMEADGSHPEKAGPCVRLDGLQGFISRRTKLDGCLSGARIAKDRAARALVDVAASSA